MITHRMIVDRGGLALLAGMLLGVLACGSAPPAGGSGPVPPARADGGGSPAGAVVIASPSPRAGDRVTRVEDLTMTLTTDDGTNIEMVKHTEEIREILEVTSGVVAKARTQYLVHDEQHAMNGKTQRVRPPHVGKTFVVGREGGVVRAALAGGGEAPADELAAVSGDHDWLGRADGLDSVLASQPWRLGERVTFTPTLLARLNDGRKPGERYEAMVLTLVKADGDVATFAMEARSALQPAGGTLNLEVRGTVRYDARRGRPLELVASGPVHGDLGVAVRGTMSIKLVWSR